LTHDTRAGETLKRLALIIFVLLAFAVEAPAATSVTEKLLTDADGKTTGIQVHVNGLVLTAHSQEDSLLQLDGMPTVKIEKEALTSRPVGVSVAGNHAVRFTFDGQGYLRSAVVGNATLDLSLASKTALVTETLKNASGRTIAHATVSGSIASLERNPPFCLDAVKAPLGLDDPSITLLSEHPDGSSLTIIRDSTENQILYIITFGGNRFGFDAAGKPLFIDAALDLAQSALSLHGSEHNPIAMHDISAVAPNRIVVTADGRIGACVDGPAAGAIASFWSTETDKVSGIAFRLKPNAASNANSHP